MEALAQALQELPVVRKLDLRGNEAVTEQVGDLNLCTARLIETWQSSIRGYFLREFDGNLFSLCTPPSAKKIRIRAANKNELACLPQIPYRPRCIRGDHVTDINGVS